MDAMHCRSYNSAYSWHKRRETAIIKENMSTMNLGYSLSFLKNLSKPFSDIEFTLSYIETTLEHLEVVAQRVPRCWVINP